MQKTKIEIRLYKAHDPDLIMLTSYGISISSLVKKALLNYVEGKNEKYYIPRSKPCTAQNKSYRYHISIEDPRVAELMQNIKFRYRNAFCKALLRDMLLIDPLGIYFSQNAQIEYETNRIKEIATSPISPIILNGKKKQKNREVHTHESTLVQTVDCNTETPSIATNCNDEDSTKNTENSADCIDFINRMEQLIGI